MKRPRRHKRLEAPQSRLEGCVRDGRHGSPRAPRAQQTFLIFSLAVVKLESVFNRYAFLKYGTHYCKTQLAHFVFFCIFCVYVVTFCCVMKNWNASLFGFCCGGCLRRTWFECWILFKEIKNLTHIFTESIWQHLLDKESTQNLVNLAWKWVVSRHRVKCCQTLTGDNLSRVSNWWRHFSSVPSSVKTCFR